MLKIASRWQSVNHLKSTTTATSSEDSGSTELHVTKLSIRDTHDHGCHHWSAANQLERFCCRACSQCRRTAAAQTAAAARQHSAAWHSVITIDSHAVELIVYFLNLR